MEDQKVFLFLSLSDTKKGKNAFLGTFFRGKNGLVLRVPENPIISGHRREVRNFDEKPSARDTRFLVSAFPHSGEI